MTRRTRSVLLAATLGLLAAAASIIGGVILSDDGPRYDGEFVLDQPGIFQEPVSGSNHDHTGATLPDVSLVDANNDAVSLTKYVGKPLVVNVWFSTCAPCRRELRDFATVQAEVGDRVQFVGVDPFDSLEVMERFADERGVSYDLLRDPERTFSDEIGIVSYPVTLFVGADGEVLRQTGEMDADDLRAAIAELF